MARGQGKERETGMKKGEKKPFIIWLLYFYQPERGKEGKRDPSSRGEKKEEEERLRNTSVRSKSFQF